MSDRIDTMAAALIAALGKYGTVHDAGDGWTTLTLHHDDMPRIARRLLAAMDAEPTDAEIDAAAESLAMADFYDADWNAIALAALMAARGARPEAV